MRYPEALRPGPALPGEGGGPKRRDRGNAFDFDIDIDNKTVGHIEAIFTGIALAAVRVRQIAS